MECQKLDVIPFRPVVEDYACMEDGDEARSVKRVLNISEIQVIQKR